MVESLRAHLAEYHVVGYDYQGNVLSSALNKDAVQFSSGHGAHGIRSIFGAIGERKVDVLDGLACDIPVRVCRANDIRFER